MKVNFLVSLQSVKTQNFKYSISNILFKNNANENSIIYKKLLVLFASVKFISPKQIYNK
ncbi:hypothetical protein MSIBF_A2080016 [groundwater metagenome]|uniref:Uncharacterized protein n=1 Tax=groundwater metagenome TaxID=717931 RepID=A0A098E8C2_9ZZZZ